jgi:hypothetical protein
VDGLPVRVPDLIEPFDGYRSWSYSVVGGRVRLFPLHVMGVRAGSSGDDGSRVWEGAWRRWVTASCARGPYGQSHEAPDESCSCGFYAMKDPSDVIVPWPLGKSFEAPGIRTGVVSGRVALAGKLIEHEHGYRAERARIHELIASSDDIDGTLLVATLLDLPVVAGIAPIEGGEPTPNVAGRRFRSSGRPKGLPPAA